MKSRKYKFGSLLVLAVIGILIYTWPRQVPKADAQSAMTMESISSQSSEPSTH